MICENCGKIGTTPRAIGTADRCLRMPAETSSVARGCGFSGRVAPFGGRAKLVWNVDWAARWGMIGATIEGCGKDLATAGGSRDRANAISRRVFEHEPPLDIPYEFLNLGGRKMSTSKGVGAAAHEIAALLPPTLLAVPVPALSTQPRHQLRSERRRHPAPLRRVRPHRQFRRREAPRGELPPDADRIFALALPDPDADTAGEAARYRPPFGHWRSSCRCRARTSSSAWSREGRPLEDREKDIAIERIAAARLGWQSFAGRLRAWRFSTTTPAAAAVLELGISALPEALAAAAESAKPGGGEAWQGLIFEVSKQVDLRPGDAFGAHLSGLPGPFERTPSWLAAGVASFGRSWSVGWKRQEVRHERRNPAPTR